MVESLKLIRGFCYKHDQNNYQTYAVVSSLNYLLYYCEKPDVTNDEYLKEFKESMESMDDFDACMENMMMKYEQTQEDVTERNKNV